jgi:hypothetical protein
MPDYQRGKIYKITSGDLTYVGSTTEKTLARRLSGHIRDYKRWKNGKKRPITSFQVIDKGDYEITLLELFPCGSKDEMTARERYWIENTVCVNKVMPNQTQEERKEYHREHDKQYRQDHKEQCAKRQKEYYIRNREKVLSKLKEKRIEQNSIVM